MPGRSRQVTERLNKIVATEFPARLSKAARAARDAEEAWKLAIEARDDLIVEAIDVHGMPQTAVAELVGVRKGRIHAILVGSQPDAGER